MRSSVGRSALVAFEGNHYSVSPGLVGQLVTVSARLGELHVEILSAVDRRVARHRRAPAGAGQQLRSPEHARLLEQAVLDAFTTHDGGSVDQVLGGPSVTTFIGFDLHRAQITYDALDTYSGEVCTRARSSRTP